MFKKLYRLSLIVLSILFFVCSITVCHAAEGIVRTIEIQYPSKQINGSTTVVGVQGCQYTFTVVGSLPGGTHIEWTGQTTTKGSWSNNVLYPYVTGGGGGTYHITAVLVGGEGEGPGWAAAVNGTITDPVLTYSEPGEDTYFAVGQTAPTPQVDLKVTVTKPGGTKLQGVSVNFKAEKFGGGFVALGTSSSNSSGEATKTWNADVSARQRFTLKAGTGPSYENEVTGEKVYVLQLFAMTPTPSHFRTAKSSKTAEFKAELHDSQGIATSATENVTFELTSNPRGSIQSPVSAIAGVATSTYTPPGLEWGEEEQPRGDVKTDVTESFRSSTADEYIYAIPIPGIDIRVINTNIDGLYVSLWSEQIDRGPPIPTDYVADEFRASSEYGVNTCNVTVDWGDGEIVEYDPETFVTGVGVRNHTYGDEYEGEEVTVELTVDGVVRRTLKRTETPPSDDIEWHDYGDTDDEGVQL